MNNLTQEQQKRVLQTLESMTMEEMVGQLLCPENRKYSTEDWMDIFRKVPLGSVFFGKHENLKGLLEQIQLKSRIPVAIAVDMESGVDLVNYGTQFPTPMALGAARDPELAYEQGRALAHEARALGIHWTFSPVVDINLNFNNPVTCTRSFGDKAEKVAAMVAAAIRGRQADGLLAATAKHFPGDGVDDRDQHACTSVNSLPMDQWQELYGKVWRAAIQDAGVMSIMSGHISLPDYQGCQENPTDALPATLSSKLQVDLLRNELGFKGVLVSDAAPMIGITSRVSSDEMVVKNIASGSDVFLFADPIKDFERLMAAVRNGKLKEERVREAVQRSLEMKELLGIFDNPFGREVSQEMFAHHKKTAKEAAERSMTVIKNNGKLPVSLKPGAKILTVTMTYKNHARQPQDLDIVDAELKQRGFEVTHLLAPDHNEVLEEAPKHDFIFVNFYVTMHMKLGTMRLTAEAIMSMWRAFYSDYGNVIFTSFGNPYVLYEQPHIQNLMLTFGSCEASQRAAVKAWLGEIEPTGVCPVHLPQVKIKRFEIE